MKAWRIERHGGPDTLKNIDVPSPVAGPMQVLVRVQAVGLNHLDVWVRKGVEGHRFPLPLTPGSDIAGVIAAFGPGAEASLSKENLKIHSPVLLNPGISCGRCEACLNGFDPLCNSFGIFGETQDGGCADFVVAPLANIIARPPELSAVEGASLPIPFITAWSMLTRKALIRPSETVLIQAGGSGVSVAAIQIAKLFGATVITTVGSDDKVEKARSLGADYIIQYQKNLFRTEMKRILMSLGKKGCEVVLDHVGSTTFQDSLKSLAWGGRLVTCGATSGAQVEIDLKPIFFKNLSILGSTMGSKGDLIRILELLRIQKLKTVIDRIYPMSELPQALERLEKREAFGKVMVTQE